MRILQIVNSLTHTSIPVEVACEMMKTEDVEIAALYNTQKEADQFAEDMRIGCKIYGFGYNKDKVKGLKDYIGFLKRCSYDVINTHHSLSGTLARIYCYGRIKLVHTVHANYHSYTKGQNFLIGSTLNRTDAVVFNSKSSQVGLYDWEKKKIKNVRQEVIYNGVNVDRIQNASDEFWKRFCIQNGIQDDDIVLTQIGRLEPVKNPMGALQAFAHLRYEVDKEKWDRLRFVFMGNGSEYKKMSEFVNENNLMGKVFLPGVIKRDDVYSWMKRADVLVVPSFYEGFCNTLVEGMVAGMPFTISDLDVFKEIVPNDTGVVRFNPKDKKQMTMAMSNTLLGEKRKAKYSVYGRKKFGIENSVSGYFSLYSILTKKQ